MPSNIKNDDIAALKRTIERHAAELVAKGFDAKPATASISCQQCGKEIDVLENWDETMQAMRCPHCGVHFVPQK